MDITLQLDVKPEYIIEAVKNMNKEDRDAFIEELLAVTSPEYINSINEARADYKAGRISTHFEVFGK